MSSQPLSSDSSSFEMLHPLIQRWIWAEGWDTLRDVQEQAIPPILTGTEDVVVAASTASGKTEAAFLPILTAMLNTTTDDVGTVLYISPLKALINDQFKRMSILCEMLEIPVIAWHGDIDSGKKQKFYKNQNGIVLITPESVEAMLVNRGSQIEHLFSNLKYIVIDEMHAFIGTERGKQLQSLMHRLETEVGCMVPRIGLSATLGDMNMAARFLRPNSSHVPTIVNAGGAHNELWISVKGYYDRNTEPEDAEATTGQRAIIDNIYDNMRGDNNLVFPNGRSKVELYANWLRRKCRADRIPNEFWPHHGSMSKTLREETEMALKDTARPSTGICTTTLELGIDIGHIKSVAQIGTPPSVASLRQRLGRSGRRKDEPAILRGYVIERELGPKCDVSDMLREDLLGLTASIRLLLRGWFEPSNDEGLHLSTMVQQTLSLVAQYSGISPAKLWHILVKTGPFSKMSSEDFKSFLKGLKDKELIYQDPDGTILPTLDAERFINKFEFFTSFQTEDEFTIMHAGKELGSMPLARPLQKNERITFASRSWKVISASAAQKMVIVEPTNRSAPPIFTGSGFKIHDQIRKEIFTILNSDDDISFLDTTAKGMLLEARDAFKSFELDTRTIIPTTSGIAWFTWAGDIINDTIVLILGLNGLTASNQGICISIDELGSKAELVSLVKDMDLSIKAEDLTVQTDMLEKEKWDTVLPYELLQKTFASSNLDLTGAIDKLKTLLK